MKLTLFMRKLEDRSPIEIDGAVEVSDMVVQSSGGQDATQEGGIFIVSPILQLAKPKAVTNLLRKKRNKRPPRLDIYSGHLVGIETVEGSLFSRPRQIFQIWDSKSFMP